MTHTACLLTGMSLIAVAAARPGAGETARLGWLTGCWEMRRGALVVEEQWMAPRGGTMLGMSRTARGDSTLEYELVVIRSRGDTLVYQAHPSGQPGAEFAATEVSDSHVVFANPAHDFPQRISYRARPDSLVARVEGMRGGRTRSRDFPYRRAACGADAPA